MPGKPHLDQWHERRKSRLIPIDFPPTNSACPAALRVTPQMKEISAKMLRQKSNRDTKRFPFLNVFLSRSSKYRKRRLRIHRNIQTQIRAFSENRKAHEEKSTSLLPSKRAAESKPCEQRRFETVYCNQHDDTNSNTQSKFKSVFPVQKSSKIKTEIKIYRIQFTFDSRNFASNVVHKST